jgi:sugar lactone lactonase YvrE
MRFLASILTSVAAFAQASYPPPNDGLPNPYTTVANWGKLPDDRKWGSTAGVDIAPNGNVWAYDRCGANNCDTSKLDPVVEFDVATGKALRHFGAGLLIQPHGFHVDREGNVWVTDAQGREGKGHQVFKFSPDGKVLMTLGKAGVAGTGPDTFNAPTDVLVGPNGDIFVSAGHSPAYGDARIVKFSKEGKFLKQWGTAGAGPGQLVGPHCLAMDSAGRLLVCDRTNNRVQMFDQEGNVLAEWKQFGRPSGIYIDRNDMMYVTDSESNDREGAYGYNPGVKRGIRIGSVKDGKVTAFIPDPNPQGGSSTAEGVAVDREGNVYGAEVGPRDLKKYAKK